MAKGGMRHGVYNNPDPTFNAVWAKWKKEERAAREERRAMIPFRVLGIMRMFARRAGYRLLSDLTIQDTKTGIIYTSKTEISGKKVKK